MSEWILKLDAAGAPHRWINEERAVYYLSKGLVAWTMGDHTRTLHGGYNAKGERSMLEVSSIMAVRGRKTVRGSGTVPLEKRFLLRRDKNICAYCGDRFDDDDLQMEHIVPSSRGGPTSWNNVVTACGSCNLRKSNRTPEESGMPLLYVPYVPNRHEGLILANRRILSCQMAFLMSGVPRHSRLRQ
jgi:5-methylcytosine-specific restriction endonuclease McrA